MFELSKLINNLLKKYPYFSLFGKGQHGYALLNKKNNKVYKFTLSNAEFEIANKIFKLNNSLSTLPKIYLIRKFKNFNLYIRDSYNEIPDNLAELIGENIDEIADFFDERKNWDSKKSNTNLINYFDNKFLLFLSQLKRDLHKINLLPYNWDIDGLPLNLGLDRNNNYILFDF